MYCCLTLQTVINHKPAGDLSQRAERPFIVPGLPPHSSGLHSGFTPGKKKKSVVNLSLPDFYPAPALPLGFAGGAWQHPHGR